MGLETLIDLWQLLEEHVFAMFLVIIGLTVFIPKFNQMWNVFIRGHRDNPLQEVPVKRDAAIRELMYECLYSYEADKVHIYQYHNGGRNAAGIPFAKFSCTQEIVKPGKPPVAHHFQNLPASIAWMWNEAVVEHKIFSFWNREQLKHIDPAMHELFRDYNTEGCITVGLYDIHENALGFLTMLYMEPKEGSLDAEQTKDLVNIATRIGGLLSTNVDPER